MSSSHSKPTHTAKEDSRSCDDGAQLRIQAFPPEVLSEIFLIASHSVSRNFWFAHEALRLPHEKTVYIKPSPDTLPCTLTRVCKSWRRTALTTPTLWSQIDLELGEGGGRGSDAVYPREAVLRMASNWITLSRNSPLYVSISIFEDAKLPGFLLESMSRWRGLRLNATSVCDVDFLDSLVDKTLPDRAEDLEQLDVLSVQAWVAQNIYLSKFPKINHLSGNWLKIIPEPDAIYHIKYLRAAWQPEDSLRMIASLPSLTTLIVEIYAKRMWMAPSHCTAIKQITSRTENLHFNGGGKGLISILSCTAFPAVCEAHLAIMSDGYGYHNIASPLQECFSFFFQECSSTLIRLNLTFRTSFKQEDIIKTIYHATSITHLTLRLKTEYDEFLLVLYALEWCNSREDNLCPHLVSLNISNDSGPDSSQLLDFFDQLVRTVRTRMEKNKSVQVEISLGLRRDQATHDFLSDELRSLQDQGVLKLNLYCRPQG